MGTSAMIGIYNKDGSVTASYVHYDGYVEGVGHTLVNSYNDMYDAECVAKGGYMPALYDDYLKSRQRAVHDEPATTYGSIRTFTESAAYDTGAEYLYLFDGEAWFFMPTYKKGVGFEEVKMNLKNDA